MEDKVWEALKTVLDTELGISIVDLGLIYSVKMGEGGVDIKMTLTSPGCPLAPLIDEMVRKAVGEVEGVKKINLEIVWDPPWSPELMSEEVRAELGM